MKINLNPAHLRSFKRISLGMAILMIAAASISTFSSFFDRLETLTTDYRYRSWNSDAKPSDQIVVIDIDDESLKFFEPEFGAWPWPRSVYKKVIEYLSLSQPKAVLFDIIFSERQKDPVQDQLLAEASSSYPGISHALKFMEQTVVEGKQHADLKTALQNRKLSGVDFSDRALSPRYRYGFHDYLAPNSSLLESNPEIHIVNAIKDPDGIFRRGHSLFEYDQQWFPGLALKGVLSNLTDAKINIGPSKLRILGKSQAGNSLDFMIPIDSKGQIAYHFYRNDKPFKVFQIGRLLQQKDKIDKGEIEDPGTLDPNPLEAFKDKIVLIGASAVGLEDLKATPIHQSLPGVLLHATTISNILDQRYLKSLPIWSHWLITGTMMLFIYGSVFFCEAILARALLPILMLATYAALALWSFQIKETHLPLATPFLFGFLALLDAFVHMTFVEGQAKKKMMLTLSKFLPPEVAEELIRKGIDPTAEVGQRRSLTILFSDIRGFTTLSESRPAEEIVAVLNKYLGKMTEIVFSQKGTLDKFIGDAVMCFWNAPSENPRHPESAVMAALQMSLALKELNQGFAEKGIDPLAIGIGVHTGEAIVGNIGSERRLDYTIIGDNVNLASRLEGLTKQYGVEIIIGPETYDRIKNVFLCRPVDHVVVKGKTEAVRIYEPLCLRAEAKPEDIKFCEQFELGHKSYLKGDFTLSELQFQAVLKIRKDPLTALYVERIQDLKLEPPLQWTGTYTAKSK